MIVSIGTMLGEVSRYLTCAIICFHWFNGFM